MIQQDIATVLGGLGLNLAASAVWDFINPKVASGIPLPQFERALDDYLKMHGVSVRAKAVIEAFAKSGILTITGSTLYAAQKITMGSGPRGQFSFGNDSVSRTRDTEVRATGNAQIVTTGDAQVVQENGAIVFRVGK